MRYRGQDPGSAAEDLFHRNGQGRDRPEIREVGRGLHRERPHGSDHDEGRRDRQPGDGHRTARYLRYHDDSGIDRHVPRVQVHSRAHGPARHPDGRDLGRAVRLQVHGFRAGSPRLPAGSGKADPRDPHVRRTPGGPLHQREQPGGARSLRRPRVRRLCDAPGPIAQDEHPGHRQVPAAAGVPGGRAHSRQHPDAGESGVFGCGRALDARRSHRVRGEVLHGRGV